VDSPTIQLMHRHGSVRRYKADPVSAELIERIAAQASLSVPLDRADRER
jgi:nitroreductase